MYNSAMGETQVIDSRAMTQELLEHQPELHKLWRDLGRLSKIKIGKVVEIPSILPVVSEIPRSYEKEKVVGLEQGRLIAVKSLRSQPESYDLLCLDTDARYGTEFPLKPVIVTHDTGNPTLPIPIRVEKWPFGFKIHWGSRSRYWEAYNQRGTSFYELTEEVTDQAKEICERIVENQ